MKDLLQTVTDCVDAFCRQERLSRRGIPLALAAFVSMVLTAGCKDSDHLDTAKARQNSILARDKPDQAEPRGPWKAVSSGELHSCAIADDGTVWCWGRTTYGLERPSKEAEVETRQASETPEQVTLLNDVVGISSGARHNCAIRSDGAAWCWGWNGRGQLGAGQGGSDDHEASHTPLRVIGLHDVVRVSCGVWHTCAVRSDGTAWCWGDGRLGQLGAGKPPHDDGTSNTPVQVIGLSEVADIACGEFHTCAVKKDGTVWCWGRNILGECGDGATTPLDDPRLSAGQVVGLHGVSMLSSGYWHSCALKGDGTVWCWGDNEAGKLGDASREAHKNTPVRVAGLGQVTHLSAGAWHSCAVVRDGSAWCWGRDLAGQRGERHGNFPSPARSAAQPPTPVAGFGDATLISGGYSHSCAIKSDGTLWCWGDNLWGQLGDGTRQRHNAAVQLTRPRSPRR